MPALIAAAVAIFGWAIVERFARARERRSDLKAMITSFGDLIDDVTAAALAFYKLDGATPDARTLAATIRGKIGSLPSLIRIMRAAGMDISADNELRLYRQAVTGGEFDSMSRQALAPNSPVYVSIAAAGQALRQVAQTAYYQSFVVKNAWRFWKRDRRNADPSPVATADR